MAPRVTMKYVSGLAFVGRFTAIARRESLRGVNESSVMIREVMVQASPFGGTSNLRQSWQVVPAGTVIAGTVGGGTVAKGSIAANVMETGAVRHFPPVGPTPALGVWIRRKLGITDPSKIRQTAFAIGRTFKKHGAPTRGGQKVAPSKRFSKAFRANRGRVIALMGNMSARISKGF